MRGRHRKSSAEALGDGDLHRSGARKFLQSIKSRPQTAHDLSECPPELSLAAREAWHFIATELTELKIDFGSADAVTLRGCATAAGRAIEAASDVQTVREQIARIERSKTPPAEKMDKLIAAIAEIRKLEGLERRSWELYLKFADRLGGLHPLGRRGMTSRRSKTTLADLLDADDPPVQ